LSGGQRQRVAIGRAIIRRPKVFLFDEPLSNLDAKLRSQMRIELQKLHREINATMIYVTHDQTEAMTLGNRIAVLNKGNLMQLDTPLQLYKNPDNRFVAGFIGSPTMNFIKGILKKEENYFFIETSPGCKILLGSAIPSALQSNVGNELEIGIRPENIIISKNEIEGISQNILEVAAYENMGNEQLIYLSLNNQTLIARRQEQDPVEIGFKFFVSFPEEKIIFIDPSNGEVFHKTD
jgi:multiple sugar transport system ATP-binding protein